MVLLDIPPREVRKVAELDGRGPMEVGGSGGLDKLHGPRLWSGDLGTTDGEKRQNKVLM